MCVLSDTTPRWVESADRDRIVQVLVNLLKNAEKYGPPAGQIAIELRDAGAYYEIRVADQGGAMQPLTSVPQVYPHT